MAYLPCKNPNCRSQGKAHPNCHCYDNLSGDQIMSLGLQGKELPGTTKGMTLQGTRGGNARNARARGRRVLYAAHGGMIENYCDIGIPHQKGCEYYDNGGNIVAPGTSIITPEPAHPSITLGHLAAHHGLLNILRDTGKSSLANPEKHHKTMGKIRDHLSIGQLDKAADALHGHPLSGGTPRTKLDPIIQRLANPVLSQEINPGALRSATDYLHSAIKGHENLSSHMEGHFDPQKKSDRMKHDEGKRKELDDYLKNIQENPQSLLEIGGSLGHYLPEHAAEIGALSARASDYLNTMRPKEKQLNPLDEPIPPDENVKEQFGRNLDLANNPMLLLQHARDGQLIPSDIKTVQVLYPKLFESMQSKAAESLIEAKTKKKDIPYHQGVSLGMILGQPLDGTMTPMGIQAIMRANSGIQDPEAQPMPAKKKSSGKATGVELKQINKVDAMAQTPIEARQIANKAE